MYLPQADIVSGNLVLRHFDFREIVHAKTNKVEVWDRRRDLVIRDFRVSGSGREKAVLGPIEQFVAAYFDVLATKDKDVDAGKAADCEARYGHAFDWFLYSSNALVLTDEVGQIEAAAGYAYACLTRRGVGGWVDRACKTGTFVLNWGVLWGQDHSFADEGDAIGLDQELLSVGARVDDDAAATGCVIDRCLDRLVVSDTNRLVVSFPGCRYRSVRHQYGVVVARQTFSFGQRRSTNERHEQCNEEYFEHHAGSILTSIDYRLNGTQVFRLHYINLLPNRSAIDAVLYTQ